jgi:integrase
MKSGKTVWDYQTYDEDGRRTVAHSTGEETKTAAVKKCNALMREGKLLPKAQTRIPNFLAACTGMRIGEVLGLRGKYVFADFIRVQGQYGKHGYGPTKTRLVRVFR